MAGRDRSVASKTAIVIAGIVVVVLIGIVVGPLVSDHWVNTPPSGTRTAAQTGIGTTGAGVPAQSNAESTQGKSNPAGPADQSGGRSQAQQGRGDIKRDRLSH